MQKASPSSFGGSRWESHRIDIVDKCEVRPSILPLSPWKLPSLLCMSRKQQGGITRITLRSFRGQISILLPLGKRGLTQNILDLVDFFE